MSLLFRRRRSTSSRTPRKPRGLTQFSRYCQMEMLERKDLMTIAPVGVDVYGGPLQDTSATIAFDGPLTNNRYVAGEFSGTVDFDLGPVVNTLTSQGDRDVFVAKYAADGNLLWVKDFGGPGSDFQGYTRESMVVDSVGNAYLQMSVTGSVDFGGTMLTDTSVLFKLDASGDVQWARPAIGSQASQLAIHEASQSLYAVGTFDGTLQVGNQTLTGTNQDGFLVKLDATTGQVVSAFQTTGVGRQRFSDVAVDNTGTGAVYVSGDFCGVGTIGSTSYTVGGSKDCTKNSLAQNGVIVRFDLDNHVVGSSFIKATLSKTYLNVVSADQIIAQDGEIYVRGESPPAGTLTFGSISTPAGAYVTRLDAEGRFLWATRTETGGFFSWGLAVDSRGNVYSAASQYPDQKHPTIEPTNGHYIKRLDAASGTLLDSWRVGPLRNYSMNLGAYTTSLAVDALDHLWAAGHFYGTNTFPDNTTRSSVNSTADLFVLRFDDVESTLADIAASIAAEETKGTGLVS